ncbi:OsmC family protein [Variovorax paradoxus]|uniref:OsmC family protein n=1 Tax=Variovorax paradoxus TaxID=34073 RepID=UPI00278B72CE|nr:OsmC family protein [Variovorax paradoxus]MDP9927832.1 putative OsmC-like protein [Variovorax paradoxus]
MKAPIVRRKSVRAHSEAIIRTVINGDFGEMAIDEAAPAGTGTGPSPLQAVLGALCGCLAITFRRVASDRGFAYTGVALDAEFAIDIRGRLGVPGVLPYFNYVVVTASVTTGEPAEVLEAAARETLVRSPVYNLLKATAARLDVQWQSVAAQPA